MRCAAPAPTPHAQSAARDCVGALLAHPVRQIAQVLGHVEDLARLAALGGADDAFNLANLGARNAEESGGAVENGLLSAVSTLADIDGLAAWIAKDSPKAARVTVEKIFDECGLDYALETGPYQSGLLFRSTKVGVFFYVAPHEEGRARALLLEHGFKA